MTREKAIKVADNLARTLGITFYVVEDFLGRFEARQNLGVLRAVHTARAEKWRPEGHGLGAVPGGASE